MKLNLSEWIVPLGLSLVVHAFILGLFVLTAGPSAAPAASAGASSPAPAESGQEVANAAAAPVAAAPSGALQAAPEPVAEPPPQVAHETAPIVAEAHEVAPQKPVAAKKPPVRKPAAKPEAKKPEAKKPVPAAHEGQAPESPSATPGTKTYKVQLGDTLFKIARDCGCTPHELAKLNGVDVKSLVNLKVGQTIKIKAE